MRPSRFLPLSLLVAAAAPPTCSAIVVDAATNHPLAGVRGRSADLPLAAIRTDAQGHFPFRRRRARWT